MQRITSAPQDLAHHLGRVLSPSLITSRNGWHRSDPSKWAECQSVPGFVWRNAHIGDPAAMAARGEGQTRAALFTRHVMFGQDPQAAVSAPRWLLGRTWSGDSTNLKLESRFDPALLDASRAAGQEMQVVGPWEDMMGHAGAVCVHPGGRIEGATDLRADGICAGV